MGGIRTLKVTQRSSGHIYDKTKMKHIKYSYSMIVGYVLQNSMKLHDGMHIEIMYVCSISLVFTEFGVRMKFYGSAIIKKR